MSSIRGNDQRVTQRVPDWVAALDALPEPIVGLASCLHDDVVALRRLVERAQVAYLHHLARLDSSSCGVVGDKTVAGYVADEVGLPLADVRGELKLARSLHTDTDRPLEGTRILLTAGTLTVPQAKSIARAMTSLTAADARNIEPTVAQSCASVAPSATAQVCNHAVKIAGDEESAMRREEKAYASRQLHISPLGDMFRVDGLLTGEAGATILAALDPLAEPTPGEAVLIGQTRSRSQLMHDALTELARRQLNTGQLPTSGGVRPTLHITVDVTDLLALSGAAQIEGRSRAVLGTRAAARIGCDSDIDWSITTTRRTNPGELVHPGHPERPDCDQPASEPPALGPPALIVTGAARSAAGMSARDLAALATAGPPRDGPTAANLSLAEIAPGIIDPALLDAHHLFGLLKSVAPALGGSAPIVLNAGRTSRLVTPAQRKQLIHRDKGCVYPGCDKPPEWCEAHHLTPWIHGGNTNLDLLALVCCYHHTRLHLNGRTLELRPDGWHLTPTPDRELSRCA